MEYRDLIGQLWTDPLHDGLNHRPGDLATAIGTHNSPLPTEGLVFWVLSFYVDGAVGVLRWGTISVVLGPQHWDLHAMHNGRQIRLR